mmetsp:Transcript_35224/g.110059  ORF Transcript_35224/g.110059 Transcript_35224/m.110059 type:complete len:81 (-) Transcript_35224:225-467(-)
MHGPDAVSWLVLLNTDHSIYSNVFNSSHHVKGDPSRQVGTSTDIDFRHNGLDQQEEETVYCPHSSRLRRTLKVRILAGRG